MDFIEKIKQNSNEGQILSKFKYTRIWADEVLECSKNLGNEIDEYYVVKSKKENYPFWAETEEEYDSFTTFRGQLFQGHPKIIQSAISGYRYGGRVNKNPMKADYFVNKIKKDAEERNDYCSQALLMQRMVTEDEKERAEYEKQYKEKIENAALAGDAQAQYAQGLLISPFGSLEGFEWLLKAGEQGLSDAYFELAEYINSMYYNAKLPFPEYDELIIYYRLAAEADNGLYVPYAQYNLAEAYEEGNGDLRVDYDKALFWYQKAAEGGFRMAEFHLEHIQEHGMDVSRIGLTNGVSQLTPEKIRERFSPS